MFSSLQKQILLKHIPCEIYFMLSMTLNIVNYQVILVEEINLSLTLIPTCFYVFVLWLTEPFSRP